jgi:hypothetical protein
MPLQPTGPISLSQIRNEFKASSGSVRLGELYRGGAFVPDGYFYTLDQVPINSTIRMGQFRNTTKGSLKYEDNFSDGGSFSFQRKIAGTDLGAPTYLNRVRIVLIGPGGGGKVRLATNNQYLGGGGGGYLVVEIYNLNTVVTTHGGSNINNLDFLVRRGSGGGTLVASGNQFPSDGTGSLSFIDVRINQQTVWSCLGYSGEGGTSSSGDVYAGGNGGGAVVNNTSLIAQSSRSIIAAVQGQQGGRARNNTDQDRIAVGGNPGGNPFGGLTGQGGLAAHSPRIGTGGQNNANNVLVYSGSPGYARLEF